MLPLKLTPRTPLIVFITLMFSLLHLVNRWLGLPLLDSQTLSISKKSVIKQKNFKEKIHRLVQSFEVDGEFYTFLESNHFLTLLKTKGYSQTEISTAPLTRFSFVSGYVLQESVQPIVIRDGGTWRPALYVDSSYITSRYIYSWIFDGERLFSPIELSLSLPPRCRSQNVSPWGHQQGFTYVFLCSNEEGDKWWFKFLPAEL